MNKTMLKRLLSLVMVIAMVLSFAVLPVTAETIEETVTCTKGDDCTATTHESDCAKYVVPCTKGEDCAAATHESDCAKYVVPCTKGEDCAAATHESDCAKYVVPCTKGEDCAAATHESDCVKYVVPCTKGEDCTASAHETDCPKHPDYALNPAGDEGTTSAGNLSTNQINMNDESDVHITAEISGLNATESVVVKLLSGNETIATTTLQKTECLSLSTLGVKISITGTDDSWATGWETGMPRADVVPTTMELWVDGTKVSEANFVLVKTNGEAAINWTDVPGVNPVPSVACIGEIGYTSLAAAVSAANDGDTIKITASGTYKLPGFGKNVTIKAAENVAVTIDNGGAVNLSGANVTFENLTFDYYPNVNYTGLQHVNTATYNKCTFNGQVFLYGAKETFNNCTFNQNSADAYNVWTYGAKNVTFDSCTFNSAGKSVLIYSEDRNLNQTVTFHACELNAAQPVAGKAAIEVDASLGPVYTVNINNTTATGFGSGSISGNTLWNEKKCNNNLTTRIYVDNELVWHKYVAQIGDDKYFTLEAALDAAESGDTVTLLENVTAAAAISETGITLDLGGKTLTLADGANNYFFGTSTIQNGTISLDGVEVGGDCIIGIGDYSNDGTLSLNNVNVTGNNYSSAYAVFYVYGSSTLNITGGETALSNDSAAAGGYIKAEDGANGKVNLTNAKISLTNAKIGFLDGTVAMDGVALTINGGANAINGSALTVNNSTLTIKDCDGRALTLNQGDVTIHNSDLNLSGATEGEIRFKSNKTLEFTGGSNLNKCSIYADSTGTVKGLDSAGKALSVEIKGSETEPYTIQVVEDVLTVSDGSVAKNVRTGETYKNIQAAVDAAQAGDTIEVIGDVTGEAVTADKSVTITGDKTLENVSITANGSDVALTVSNLSFTGKSWINANDAAALTVSGVKANVTLNRADSVTNSRAAFISLGASEPTHGLKLTVTGNNIVVTGDKYPDPVHGWRYIADGSSISNNTFGSASNPNWDAVKLMNFMDGAKLTVEGNTVYVSGNGFAFAQNSSRDNAYSVDVKNNTFANTGADYIWLEANGGNGIDVKLNATGNKIGANALTAADIKIDDSNTLAATGYAGVDVQTNDDGKLIGGTFTAFTSKALIAEDYSYTEHDDETWTIHKAKVHVVFDFNGGTNSYGQKQEIGDVAYGYQFTLEDPSVKGTPKWEGHTCTGFNTKADGTGTAYELGTTITFTEDITLYAQWKLNKVTVTFDFNGGTNDNGAKTETGRVDYGSKFVLYDGNEDGTLVRPCYVCTGFNTKADGTGTAYKLGDTVTFTGDITLYAQWEKADDAKYHDCEYTNDDKYHWQECENCDYETKQEKHDYGKWITTKKPTETETGKRYKECEVCGYKYWQTLDKVTNANTGDAIMIAVGIMAVAGIALVILLIVSKKRYKGKY